MSESGERLLVCKPLAELTAKQAATTASRRGACSECAAGVWFVPRNRRLKARLVCRPCAARLMAAAAAAGEAVVVEPARQAVDRLDSAERN